MEILLPLKSISFQPSEYKIIDRGAVAIVEMNILLLLGGGSFQTWMTTQFRNKNKNEQSKVERIVC